MTGALGLAFAGSPERLPAGTQIAGVNVSGLTAGQARSQLEQRSRALANVPVVFTAAGRRWRVKPSKVVLDVEWGAAVLLNRGRSPYDIGALRAVQRAAGLQILAPDRHRRAGQIELAELEVRGRDVQRLPRRLRHHDPAQHPSSKHPDSHAPDYSQLQMLR